MTLHMAFITPGTICCIGDRLLTTRLRNKTSTWDPLANKTVVVDSHSARFVVSYAGLAHVKRVPMDEVIVDRIIATTAAGGGASAEMHDYAMWMGPDLRTNLNLVDGAIRRVFDEDFAPLPLHLRRHGLEIMIAGWHWKRYSNSAGKMPRPFVRLYVHNGGSNTRPTTTDLFPQWGRSDELPVCCSIGAHIPPEVRTDIRSILHSYKSLDPIGIETHLANAIRAIACNPHAGVGTNLMSIIMTGDRATRIRYVRDVTSGLEDFAYTPSVIMRNALFQPLEIIGSGEKYIADIPLECIPPVASAGSNIISTMDKAKRRRL